MMQQSELVSTAGLYLYLYWQIDTAIIIYQLKHINQNTYFIFSSQQREANNSSLVNQIALFEMKLFEMKLFKRERGVESMNHSLHT